jgi:hypothetical protein
MLNGGLDDRLQRTGVMIPEGRNKQDVKRNIISFSHFVKLKNTFYFNKIQRLRLQGV